MYMSRLILVLAAAATVAVAGPAGEYVYQTIDPPAEWGELGVDLSVGILWANNTGLVVLQYQQPISANWSANMHTAIMQNNQWTVIDVPGAVSTGSSNANSHGQIALCYDMGDGIWHVAIYQRGEFRPVPEIPGYPGGMLVQMIDDHGQMAASVIDGNGVWHAFVGDVENYTVFDYPDPTVVTTTPFGVNNAGALVGQYGLADGSWHAFEYDDGRFMNIDPPDAAGAGATMVNNSTVIVGGYWRQQDEHVRGFVLKLGQYSDFTVPGSLGNWPYFLNDRGQISGVYFDSNFVWHGYVATPTDRPQGD